MKKIQLYKKYSGEDEVRSLQVNDTKENVMHMMKHGFYLTEEEAKSGKVAEPEQEKPAAKKTVAKAVKSKAE